MLHAEDPILVRRAPGNYLSEPGLHSHNRGRRGGDSGSRSPIMRLALALLIVLGLGGVGYYAYTLGDQYVYQSYENWAFDQEIAGRPGVTFADYVRERTPFGLLTGKRATPMPNAVPKPAPQEPGLARPALVEGALLGRVEINRLGLSAIVREGVGAHTLSTAVGHIPSTSLPGQAGNFAIAAHRDTLFRALKDIRTGDVVTFQSTAGSYSYEVAATKIVKPSDVSVLRSDGGGLISPQPASQGADKLLTMITCYPFYYVGSAPKRFIVEARLVDTAAGGTDSSVTASRSTVKVPLPMIRKAPPAAPSTGREQELSAWPRSTARRTN